MTDNVLQFSSFSKAARTPVASIETKGEVVSMDDRYIHAAITAHEAAKVRKQQDERHKAWRKASARSTFWIASLRFVDATFIAQSLGIETYQAALTISDVSMSSPRYRMLLEKHAEALGEQLLTPAPTRAEVGWKRCASRTGLKIPADRLDRSIAEDLAWLERYPASVRRSRRKPD